MCRVSSIDSNVNLAERIILLSSSSTSSKLRSPLRTPFSESELDPDEPDEPPELLESESEPESESELSKDCTVLLPDDLLDDFRRPAGYTSVATANGATWLFRSLAVIAFTEDGDTTTTFMSSLADLLLLDLRFAFFFGRRFRQHRQMQQQQRRSTNPALATSSISRTFETISSAEASTPSDSG